MTPSLRIRAARAWLPSVLAALIVTVALLVPSPALAHGNLAAGDFYTGLLQPVFHFDSLLAIIAVALWATQLGVPDVWRLPLVFMGAAFAGSVAAALGLKLDGTAWTAHVAMFVLGLLVAARFKLPAAGALALGAAAGLVHGYLALSNERETIERPVLYLFGVCSGVGLICYHLESLVLHFPAFWVRIAVRVVGSWIAAIGLLVAVLEGTGATRAAG